MRSPHKARKTRLFVAMTQRLRPCAWREHNNPLFGLERKYGLFHRRQPHVQHRRPPCSPSYCVATACEALMMGVPVLTCTGQSFSGKVAHSLLHAVGLPQTLGHPRMNDRVIATLDAALRFIGDNRHTLR
jgi:hypothetical protein